MATSQTAAPHVGSLREHDPRTPRLLHLSEVIEHAAHLLPAQGPITVFIHHNTLHAFEDLPFHEAVKKGAQVYGCQPYLTEDRYRDAMRRGRIRFAELHEMLEQDLGEQAYDPIPCFGTRLDLRQAMLQYPLRTGPTHELVWYVADQNALRRVRSEASAAVRARMIAESRRWVMRDLRAGYDPSRNGHGNGRSKRRVTDSLSELLDRSGEAALENWTEEDWEKFTLQALWRVCCDGVRDLPHYSTPAAPAIRHRDVLLEATGVDADAPVNALIIRFCAAFLDQGFADWQLPRREEGFYRSFCALYRLPFGPPARWMKGLDRELARLEDEHVGPLESLLESLEILGVAEDEWESYLSRALLALPGWGGMVHQVEVRGDRVAHPIPAGSLIEYLAIRLLLDRFALAYTARTELGITAPVSAFWRLARGWVDPNWPPSVEQRAFLVFQLAQIFGLSPDVLHRLSKPEWGAILEEIETFTAIERRRVFHMAYEQRFTTQTLDAVALHARKSNGRPPSPQFQVCCCLDEREESFRRHLEELAPSVETFGAAGFYSVAMYYRGAADAYFVPLCPVVIRPQHWVAEEVGDNAGKLHERRARTRRALGTASHHFHVGTRSFALGALLSGALGVLASIPLVARILFPRLTARMRQRFGRIVQTPPSTRLRLERVEDPTGPENGHVGYSIDEMSDVGERLLRDMGLTNGFSRLLILLGHGSNSMNNPHNSAYNCGACGGSAGGPNARAMAQILNDPRVRERLAQRGLPVPDDTIVIGGYHNTCDDSVAYFDLDRVPDSHRQEFETARGLIEQTCNRNAHERCRRFMSAPLTLSFAAAREHVEGRSEDLAQTRPELGHATNAITIVGRREWSRGLYLDRRAFLTSYDPTQDDADSSILTRILGAVFPVCSGINLEYYFSHVDNDRYGAGTKLPHNLSSLLGVMDGAASDLRTGLPWQMVEIHEPVRSLFIIETTPEAMLRIIERNAGIGQLCRNAWVLLAVLHPETREISVYQDGVFRPYRPQATVLPKASSSVDWYRGWRDHLEFAEIEA
ncbi:MAG: DUF2309 domain-containing protein [Isosphaeraceae bacterium]|nr:DUF2309 domain-containing protein [Isosphaeraceae bacterium]